MKIYKGSIGLISAIFILQIFVLNACRDHEDEENTDGKIILFFNQVINQQAIEFDTLHYVNAAGNPYLINEIQYFISDLTLYPANDDAFIIDEWKDIHYVDTDISSTQKWEVFDPIAPGLYDSIAFTFGFSEDKNQSFMFVNPPERDMFWPEYLGGGYHYMKLNGKWKENEQSTQLTPFDFHMGIGQIYDPESDSIIGFVHNNFRVSLPFSNFEMSTGDRINIHIFMNVENWFEDPVIYDHNTWGGYIMQNQEAMAIAAINGHNVFSVEIEK